MIDTKLDYDLYCVIKELQNKIEEIKNDLVGEGRTIYNKEKMLDKLNVAIEDIQDAMYG